MEYDVKFKINVNDPERLKQLHGLLDYDQRELFVEDVPKVDLMLWKLTDDIPIPNSVELQKNSVTLHYENPDQQYFTFYEYGKKISKVVDSVEVGIFSGGYGAKETCIIKNGQIEKTRTKEL